jgi:PST family polysaccharide transporter
MVENKDVLKSSIIQGFGTLVVREFFLKILSFVGQIFLARLLVPSDFGIYVIVVFIVNFLGLFSDIGLSSAIIQKHEEPSREELSSVFILKMGLSILIVVLLWIFAPVIKYAYPAFTTSNILMVRILSLVIITGGIRSIPIALLERKIKYNFISVIDVLGIFIYYLTSLTFAFAHFGVWSFIFGALAKEVGETIVLYWIQPFLPQFKLLKSNIKKLVKFGIYIQGNSFVSTANLSITPVIGGRISGVYSVGLLDFAYNIASLPETIAVNFGRVAFAGFSRIQKEKEILTNSISKSISMLAILLYIFPVLIFGLGNELVPLIFSAKWIPAIPALYWYSAGTFFLPVTYALGQGILAVGKSRTLFWTTLLTVISGWIAAFFLIHTIGFVGIAITYFSIALAYCIIYLVIFKNLKFRFPIISLIAPKLLVVVITLATIGVMNITFSHGVLILFAKLFIASALYILLTYIFVRRDFVEFSRIILSILFTKRITKKN